MDEQLEAALIEAMHTGDWTEYIRLTDPAAAGR